MKKERHTYWFNPHTLRYEKVFVSLRERVSRISFSVLFGVVLGVLLVVIGLQFMESPKERAMQRELSRYKRQTRLLGDRVERAEKVIEDIEERDDVLYRTIFESEPIDKAERLSGIGGVERYSEFDDINDGELLKQTSMKVDELTKRVYIESKSLDEIYALACRKEERLQSMPAIMPVAKNKCKDVSGYGYRFHPILKYRRLHTGIDMTARVGTPVHATGDGVVRIAGRNPQGYGGYGVVVMIDHGFGFCTLYAHLNNASVRVGQKVKRVEAVGSVGSTGMSSGAHLHYEVLVNGKPVDPVYYFGGDLTPEEYDEVLELASRENQSMS